MNNPFKLIVCLFLSFVGFYSSYGQKYESGKASITFFSEAPLENIEATAKKARGLFDESNAQIAFIVSIRDFRFDKSLMQEHFNEKYMESEKYPRAIFSGTVKGFDKKAKGTQQVTAEGDLTIHGVTKKVKVKGTIKKEGSNWIIDATFNVKLEDYEVERPQMLWENIAEVVAVTVNFQMEPQ